MQVHVLCESIIMEGSHETYAWVLKSVLKMEPKYFTAELHLIFADQKITPRFLHDMGIQDSCTLCGDNHHLLDEVWAQTSGPHLHMQVRQHLKLLNLMLLGSKNELDYAF